MITALIGATAYSGDRKTMDAAPRRTWVQGARVTDGSIELTFLLKNQNVAELERQLLAVSTPGNDAYGKHLTNKQVHDLVAPGTEAIDAVHEFLKDSGAPAIAMTPNSDMIKVTVPVATAERLLRTDYYSWTSPSSEQTVARTTGYSLPHEVAKHVAAVAPTVQFPSHLSLKVGASSPNAVLNTPKSLRKLYGVDQAQGAAGTVKQAVTGFIGQKFSPADKSEFDTLFLNSTALGYDVVNVTIGLKGNDGGAAKLGRIESMLDAEYMPAMGANISTEFWGFKGNPPSEPQNEPFLDWLQLVASTADADVPKLFSTSYGEDEDLTAHDYAERINTEFMKAGARGISLLFASGDSGAAGDSGCKAGPCSGGDECFVPQWPSGSPYITAVGGTAGLGKAESAVGLSSGGFSVRWPRPAWQDEAVKTYLAGATLPDPKYMNNNTGRGFPDVAAQAVDFMVVALRVPEPVAGTSCASPTAGGIFGLVNDVRAQAGKPPLGFLNPFIYQNAAAFNDITKGSSQGCALGDGWPAFAGWDAVTGVGTPNFPAIVKAAAGL